MKKLVQKVKWKIYLYKYRMINLYRRKRGLKEYTILGPPVFEFPMFIVMLDTNYGIPVDKIVIATQITHIKSTKLDWKWLNDEYYTLEVAP